MTNGCFERLAGRYSFVWPAVLALAIWTAPSSANDESGFYSGGNFHPVIRSATELAVELDQSADRAELGARMRANGAGTLEAVPWGDQSGRFAILRAADAATQAKLRTRQMPEFKSVNRVYRMQAGGAPILGSGRIVLRLRAEVTSQERDQLFADYRVRLVQAVDGLANTYVVEPMGDAASLELKTANRLYEDDRTVYAHPDFRMPVRTEQFAPELVETDTFSANQWHLETLGYDDIIKDDADIDMLTALNRTTAAGTRIGALEDACDVMHEDLVDNYLGISHDVVTNVRSATAANPQAIGDRHGTATIGVAAGVGGNNLGISGVAPAAKFTVSRGLTSYATLSQLASAYSFARTQAVDVHNNSWGFDPGTPNPDVIVSAVDTVFREGRGGLGMVVVFASGNGSGMEPGAPAAIEVAAGQDLATLIQVIGVGASNSLDRAASYSDYGREIDVLAPSSDFTLTGSLPGIITTDNTDGAFDEPGYNNNGADDLGNPDLPDPNYTSVFGGTSAAAAIVSGIAAQILSIEPNFTATMVRNTIEHTCDKINPEQAAYDGITSRSLRYGYGRVNAGTAAERTSDGFYWPERVANVRVEGNTIRWNKNDDAREIGGEIFSAPTTTVLVVESAAPFSWHPTDEVFYSVGQRVTDPDTGATLDVTVVQNVDAELYNFTLTSGTKYFGVYSVANSSAQRRRPTYGFGVSVDSLGNVLDSGELIEPSDGSGDGGDVVLPPGSQKPRVSIEVRPLSGTSPLMVTFNGNAESSLDIASFVWDFDDGTTANARTTTHTYVVDSGTQRFFPKLTVTDVEGNVGERSVAVDVSAPGGQDGGETGSGTVRIRVSSPDSPDSDLVSGIAPLAVIVTADISGLSSSEGLQVEWDLGDGNSAGGLSVYHIYEFPGTFPITADVTTDANTSGITATHWLTVLGEASPTPGASASPTASPNPNPSGAACGVGMISVIWTVLALALLRRFTS